MALLRVCTKFERKIYSLYCSHCGAHFTNRGLKAYPYDQAESLYTTDLKSELCDTNEEQPICFRICSCGVQDLLCLLCGNTVGFTILRPCFRCMVTQTGHNWVYNATEVKSFALLSSENEYLFWGHDLHELETPVNLETQIVER
ncbi:hypothetical protein K7432_003841 [Basidiobolus ranarum]|uniref:Uncharacterized protein n=1 Tax=Basidiobolus ranarum TaxID=34480 RepID=A0ABR2W5K7_9FUNG